MFDIEKEDMEETVPNWANADWEKITDAHADDAQNISPDRIYHKVHAKHKERTGIAAVRYAALAIGLTAIGWAVREVTWLALTLGVVALLFGLISAYGAGKYREL